MSDGQPTGNHSPAARPAWLVLLGLVWVAGIVAWYYAGHKPFSPQLALNLAAAAGRFAAAAGIVSVAGGLGRRVLRLDLPNPLTRLACEAAAGLGLLAMGVLAVAVLKIHPLLAWGALLGAFALLFRDILAWWRAWGGMAALWRRSGRLGRGLAVGLAFLFILKLTTTLAPPYQWDAMAYHLALPQAYLQAGRFFYQPGVMFWGMPQTGEMLYTWATALAGLEAAAVLGWMFAVLAMTGLCGYLADRLSPSAAWVAAASLMAGFTLSDLIAWAYVDWLMLLFGWAFMVALDSWEQSSAAAGRPNTGKALLWVGAFAGFALGTKYTAGVLSISGLLALTWYSRKWVGLPQVARVGVQFGLLVGLFSLPWWLKNFMATGSPIYPLLFPAGAMDPYRLALYQHPQTYGNFWDALLLPVRFTLLGVDGTQGYSASIGPLLLALGGLAWLGWRSRPDSEKRVIGLAAWMLLPGLVVWAAASRLAEYLIQTRLYLSLFPAAALLAGAGFLALERGKLPGVRLGRVAGVLIVFIFALNLVEESVFTLQQGAPQLLAGSLTSQQYLENNLGWFMRAAEAMKALPAGARVVMLWEPRSLYCAPVCIPDDLLDRWLVELHDRGRTPPQIRAAWQEAGYTHVLVFRSGVDFMKVEGEGEYRYSPVEWQALDDFLAQLPAPRAFGDAYELYSLHGETP